MEIALSNLIDNCDMIQLETHPDAFFDRAWHTVVTENYILIKSYGRHSVKLFERSGKFIRNIGSIGKGPGEYISLYGIQLDEKKELIYLTPFANAKKIMVFNLLGESLPDIPLGIVSGKVRAYIGDDLVTCLCMPFDDQTAIAFQQDHKGTIKQFVTPLDAQFAQSFDTEIFSYQNGFGLEMHNTVVDTLYEYNTTENRLVPRFTLQTPDDQKLYFSLFELPKHYYVWIAKTGRLLVNKDTGESRFVKLKNDFFGNIDAEIWGGNNGQFINVTAAIDLKEKIETALNDKNIKDEDRSRLLDINKKINEEDSPVVFVGQYTK